MSEAFKRDVRIIQGKTFTDDLRYGVLPFVFKPILDIPFTPPLMIKAVGHGLLDGWMFAFSGIDNKGPSKLNAKTDPPGIKDYYTARIVDVDTIRVDLVNSTLLPQYKAGTHGGYIQYLTPANLDGFQARMHIRENLDEEPIFFLTTENGGLAIDIANAKVTWTLTAIQTAAMSSSKAVYEIELVTIDSDGREIVVPFVAGKIKIEREVTR